MHMSPKDKLICAHPEEYSSKHDAYYCAACNMWLEDCCCEEGACQFCADRPATPLPGQVPHGRVSGTDV